MFSQDDKTELRRLFDLLNHPVFETSNFHNALIDVLKELESLFQLENSGDLISDYVLALQLRDCGGFPDEFFEAE